MMSSLDKTIKGQGQGEGGLTLEEEANDQVFGKHRHDDDDDENSQCHHQLGHFDASKREPLFAVPEDATTPAAWEIAMLRHHYHPSVRAFAATLVDTQVPITFAGDPTKDFALSAFLNRFAYKNPKKQAAERMNSHDESSDAAVAMSQAGEQPMNTKSFLRTSLADIAPDKKFFYKFFGDQEKLRMEGRYCSGVLCCLPLDNPIMNTPLLTAILAVRASSAEL